MTDTENDYVATATAEKRLREVLAERFSGGSEAEWMADVLLAGAEITYLPRKKSVSIVLKVPETAATSNPSKVLRQDGSDPLTTAPDGTPIDAPPTETPVDNQPSTDPSLTGFRTSDDKPKAARFGEFVPTVTSAPEYHEDDYFTE